ncbi:MAG: 16S rRNA (guanine(527)-N(7))-methyltransferase RsmG [Woeseia sp.]
MDPSQFIDQIRRGVAALGQELSGESVCKCARLLCELDCWGRRMNLTAIRGRDAMVNGHVLDSLSVRPHILGNTLIDVGTGAGFPGLPLAIAEPDIDVELIDSNGKRISFIRHVIGELGISNARAIKVRVEDYEPDRRFDTVIARAFASLPRLVDLAGHLVAERGVMLAQKGRYPADELNEIPDGWEYSVSELTVPGLHVRHLVKLHRRETDG